MSDEDLVYDKLAREILMIDKQNNSLIQNYVDVIKNGLPHVSPKRKDVIVLGAGIAGLLAAKLLKESGYNVTILEANANRIGGRIKTFRDTKEKHPFHDPNQYAEAGAMRIPKDHLLVMKLIEKFDLDTQPFYNVDVDKQDDKQQVFRTWLRTNNIQLRKVKYKPDILPPDQQTLGFPVPDRYNDKTAKELLDEALSVPNALIDPTKSIEQQLDGWKRIISDYDHFSIYQYLKNIYPDDIVLQYIGTLENLTSRFFLSFVHSFIDTFYINSDTKYVELKGGNWRLPYAFSENLKENLIMDARATEILWKDEQKNTDVTVSTIPDETYRVCIRTVSESFGKTNKNTKQYEREFTADYLIITIPFSSLRFVEITPQFSYKKRRAIIELHYDAATKVLLEFSERFWEWDEKEWSSKLGTDYKGHNSYGGGSITDNPNRFIYYPSHKAGNGQGGVILASYTWSDDANRWDSIPDNNRYRLALKGLTDIYGTEIKQFYKQGQTQSWMENYYSFGEAAVFTPGQITALHPYIPKPEGHIYFAGEHTSLKHAWIEGSIESAIRVALEIHQLWDGTKEHH